MLIVISFQLIISIRIILCPVQMQDLIIHPVLFTLCSRQSQINRYLRKLKHSVTHSERNMYSQTCRYYIRLIKVDTFFHVADRRVIQSCRLFQCSESDTTYLFIHKSSQRIPKIKPVDSCQHFIRNFTYKTKTQLLVIR